MKDEIKKADIPDLIEVVNLALLLWPNHNESELHDEMRQILNDENAMIALFYVENRAIGFIQCQLRFDYVEGTQTSPVGYLEGIYVVSSYRRKGIAERLLTCAENWAKEKGCSEFAGDCELDNEASRQFHLHSGFSEVNRIVCFHKKIGEIHDQ